MLVYLYVSAVASAVEVGPAAACAHQPSRGAAWIEEVHGPQAGMRVCAHGSGGGDVESVDLGTHLTGTKMFSSKSGERIFVCCV